MVRKAYGLIETVGLVAALEAADAALKAANIELIGYELTKGRGMVLVKFSGDVGAIKVAVDAGRIAARKVNKVVATHVIPRPHQQLSCVLATSELVQLKLNIEASVGESTSFAAKDSYQERTARRNHPPEAFVTEAEYGVPLPLVEVGVSRSDETPNRKVQVVSEMVIDLQVATNEGEIIEEHGAQPQILQEIEGEEELEIDPIELDIENPEPVGVVSSVGQGINPAVLCNFCRDPACHRKKGDPKVTCIHYRKNNEEAE